MIEILALRARILRTVHKRCSIVVGTVRCGITVLISHRIVHERRVVDIHKRRVVKCLFLQKYS